MIRRRVKWSKGDVIALLSLLVAILSLFVGVVTPEIRAFLALHICGMN
ncbi:hypothetical protein G7B40_024205 [Aetokthonos hydrillicola Thurmond2011]|jgi:hypothetical protein|uniref:Uncharacterized protein n=1 Tax=Aetokthonos hydrillicola Thurmond2011 TaxID=2712845 RepID=A0AAP5MB80_9CYAN|nr:hypothetical protein [Aetokthonos hydrillicola CCALA 1050]MBW4590669.1 hypothetical protein [Aetokthonos hydrillicola CCALA 1050]MDR9897647.1 hypothetical protein [Aetokthonos hydrillicola Thurmond2011]